MSLHLHSVTDPRDKLAKLSRTELSYLARYENREDIRDNMPADIMRSIFRNNPPKKMPRPVRGEIGKVGEFRTPSYRKWVEFAFGESLPKEETKSETITAEALMMREWEQNNYDDMDMSDLRKAVKARGLKQSPKDKRQDLIAKLVA